MQKRQSLNLKRGTLIYAILGHMKGGYRSEAGLKRIKKLQCMTRQELEAELAKLKNKGA